LTFTEHIIIRLAQNRMGPNKIRFFGLFQPIFDGVKLMTKEIFIYNFISRILLINLPLLKLILSLCFNGLLFIMSLFKFMFVVLFLIIRFLVYFFYVLRFFFKSKYSILGSLRFVSQTLSFDIIFIFFILILIFFIKGLD